MQSNNQTNRSLHEENYAGPQKKSHASNKNDVYYIYDNKSKDSIKFSDYGPENTKD